MILDLHPDFRIHKLTIGVEKAPLLVIDNFVADADRLLRKASSRIFQQGGRFYPGIRAEAPPSYQLLFANRLKAILFDYFQLHGSAMSFPLCHYSLVTTPPGQLVALQRIPHIDSVESNALASIHYLFHKDLGGTAFYRHRSTGFEYVDVTRSKVYFKAIEDENAGPGSPGAEYINGDTPLFEQIAKQDGVFNRMLIYRRNSLHSGCIDKDFVPDPNPLTGRLSINSFINVEP